MENNLIELKIREREGGGGTCLNLLRWMVRMAGGCCTSSCFTAVLLKESVERWCCGWREVVLWMEGGGVVDGRGMKKREKNKKNILNNFHFKTLIFLPPSIFFSTFSTPSPTLSGLASAAGTQVGV